VNVSRETPITATEPYVSRETRRRAWRFAIIGTIAALALAAAACTNPPAPGGWSPAQPVRVDSQNLIIVTHTSHLYALPKDSSNAVWQFPPVTKDDYPVSQESHDNIKALVETSTMSADDKAGIAKKLDDLHISGPSIKTLKDAISASGASKDEKSSLSDSIDNVTKFEKNAMKSLKAFYGDIGVSADGKTAYVGSYKGILYALNTADGRTKWLRDTGDGIVGGVAVDGTEIYFGTRGHQVYALDAATAKRQWSVATKGEVWATPTIDGDRLYITSLDGSVYALDKGGKQQWVFDSASSGIASRAVVSGDAVYFGAFDDRLYSVKKSDGTMNWSAKAGNWFWGTPVVQGDTVYAASLDGKVYAVATADGAPKWNVPFNAIHAIRSAPVIVGGSLVVSTRRGEIYKLDLASGQQQGDVVLLGTDVLANLTLDGASTVYIVPTSAQLLVLDASGDLKQPGSYQLQ
jgi:outer membrane protein assembly factor BamB